MDAACRTLAQLKGRYADLVLEDQSKVFNTEIIAALELGNMLDVAEVRGRLRRAAPGVARRPHAQGLHHPRRPELAAPHAVLLRSRGPADRQEAVKLGHWEPEERKY